ncbi:MAG TPA: cellulase family glycosylhydrolase [Gaiellaceae bacterium]|nr:cellulase family glycosylhydrolase [Gaiellaceae bacterium]
MRRWAVVVLLLAALAGAALATALLVRGPGPPDSAPARPLVVGFLDDVSFRWHPARARMLDRAQATGARLIRAFIRWHLAAPERPDPGELPFDEPRLWEVDELVAGAQARGMEVLFTIWGTPAWANGGRGPSHPPTDPDALRRFARAFAARYPSVRRYAVWNEPNTELFLAPQFDEQGRSVAPAAYAELFRAAAAGIRDASPGALVAAGETSSHGRDVPGAGRAQDSHSPARFARLLAEQRPRIAFDAWAHHPYPVRPELPPERDARWPSVTLPSLSRFASFLDEVFERERTPLWVTEFGYEASPAEPRGVPQRLQAEYAARALALAAAEPRVELFVWFTFADAENNAWQSGLLDRSGAERPAYASFAAAVQRLAPQATPPG